MTTSAQPLRVLNLQIDVADTFIEGSALCNRELVTALADARAAQVEVVAHQCEGAAAYDERTYAPHGILTHRVPVDFRYEGQPPDEQYLDAVRAYLDTLLANMRKLPDVFVMGHESWVWFQDLAARYEIPSVVHLRGTPTREIANGIYPPDLTDLFVRNVLGCDWIVPIAEHFRSLVLSMGADPDRVFTFFNGYDDELFYPQEADPALRARLGIEPGARVVVTASIFRPVKRIEDIILAVDPVVEAHPDTTFLIIGSGSAAEEERLRRLAAQARHADRIVFAGAVPYELMPSYLRLGDIYICASESEGLGRSTVEATACGLYLVMSAMPAGLERTGNETMGTNFTPGDPAELARALRRVLALPEADFDAVRDRGRAYTEREYPRSKNVIRYARFLERAAQGGRRRGPASAPRPVPARPG